VRTRQNKLIQLQRTNKKRVQVYPEKMHFLARNANGKITHDTGTYKVITAPAMAITAKN
jgi:hypothetical protein